MKKELLGLIDDSELPTINKASLRQFVHKADTDLRLRVKTNELISSVSKDKYFDILLDLEDVKIYKTSSNDNESWEHKYPYRFIHKINIGWRSGSMVSRTFEECFLTYLNCKYNLDNFGFVKFVLRMLGVKENE